MSLSRRYIVIKTSELHGRLRSFDVQELGKINQYHARAARLGQIAIVDTKKNLELSVKYQQWTETARSRMLSRGDTQ